MKKNILIITCKYLFTTDILNLKQTNKYYNNIINNSEQIWNNILFLKKKVNLNIISHYTKSINKLNLRYCIIKLDTNLYNFSNLDYIDFYGTKNVIKIIPNLVKNSNKLKHINFKWQNISNSMLYVISITHIETLTYLNIAKKNKVRGGTTNYVNYTSGIHNLVNLKYLNMRNNYISVSYLFKLIFNLILLEEINLPFSINSYSMCLCTERNIDKLITNFKKINKIILSEETFCNSFRDIINYHCKDILFYN